MKVGLSLCGGGIRGAAHIGALKAFEEENIKFDAVSGTSAGSIIASLYAMGYTSDEMLKMFNRFAKSVMSIGPQTLISSMKENLGFRIKGITSSSKIEDTIKRVAYKKGIKKLSDLTMPIAIPTTDLIKEKEIVFTNVKQEEDYYIKDIEIGKAVRASSTFPGMYIPFEYNEYQFVDGGLFDGLPIEETKKLGVDKVIGINFDLSDNKKSNTMYNIILQSSDIMAANLVKESMKKADYIINVNLNGVRPFSINKMQFCYEQGYKQTREKIERLKKVIS